MESLEQPSFLLKSNRTNCGGHLRSTWNMEVQGNRLVRVWTVQCNIYECGYIYRDKFRSLYELSKTFRRKIN